MEKQKSVFALPQLNLTRNFVDDGTTFLQMYRFDYLGIIGELHIWAYKNKHGNFVGFGQTHNVLAYVYLDSIQVEEHPDFDQRDNFPKILSRQTVTYFETDDDSMENPVYKVGWDYMGFMNDASNTDPIIAICDIIHEINTWKNERK